MRISVYTKGVVWVILTAASSIVAANSIPIDAFFSGLRIQDVAISPDGQKLALTTVYNGRETVLVRDVADAKKSVPVLAADVRKRTHIKWCGWANETRLLCGMSEMRGGWGGSYHPITRLVAINADGSDRTMLTQESDLMRSVIDQDNLIDWTPDDPKSVLLELRDSYAEFPSVFAVDVYSGKRRLVSRPHAPIVSFRTDGLGHVRLGFGLKDPYFSFYARLNDDQEWRLLSKIEGLSRETTFAPIAVVPGANFAYAIKPDGDLDALWKIDLTDTAKPEVVFEHPAVDVRGARFTPTRRLIGVRYDTDRPAMYYTDDKTRELMDAVQKVLPAAFNSIVDMSRDEQTLVVKSEADIKSPTYYLVRRSDGGIKLSGVGFAYPGLKDTQLAAMRFVQYPAKDGTSIPGYLTTPVGARADKLPLIVMPHGGPASRDTWGFDSWVQFLASRGYAVLQMNFRGSSGYGENWYWSAHQDWGGLTYSDIVDGTRWAIDTGIADPKRVCIVGASFGGYAALLGATRNSDLFRCAVSIAGVSDLVELADDSRFSIASTIRRRQFSPDNDKLKEDSPRRHAETVNIPVLLIHGKLDYTVRIEHTYMMESALKQADKKFRTVVMNDNDHYFRNDADLRTLFSELELFLRAELAPGVSAVGRQ